MRYRRLLTGIICLISVFVLIGTAQAFNWYGFSQLCVDDTLKGPKDTTIKFELTEVIVYTNCYNEQATDPDGKLICQPGVGNAGTLTLVIDPEAIDPSKKVGDLLVKGCIDLSKYDDHFAGGHQHTCHPIDNPNKVEVSGSAYIVEFVANWNWIDKNGRPIKHGTDTCTYNGIIDPETCLPEHKQIPCLEEVFKK